MANTTTVDQLLSFAEVFVRELVGSEDLGGPGARGASLLEAAPTGDHHFAIHAMFPSRLKVISIVAMMASCSVMFSPAGTMLSIAKRGRSGKESCLPYLALYTQAFFWAVYGALTHHPDIVRINSIASVVSAGWLVNLAVYANEGDRAWVTPGILATIVGVVITGIAMVLAIHNPVFKVKVVSDTAFIFTLALYFAPLGQAVNVVRTKSTEGFPTALVAVGFVSACLWSEYSLLVNSIAYLVPNLVGVVMNAMQLVAVGYVMVRYPQQREVPLSVDEEKALLKREWQHTEEGQEEAW
mmetsp:Transcript_40341/g.96808  ORF Transcript_40341/g.96808 Transcript_40341/m.96808 type:complete len:297 (+) Transcript_40341:72-962(+)